MPSLLRKNAQIIAIYNRHVDTVYRVCFSFMKNKAETEDMVQETFLRLMSTRREFENEKHEKAWLIVTASNLCKDALKKWWRGNEDIENYLNLPQENQFQDNSILEAILALPEDYKTAVYMYYYEGYTTMEIAQHCGCPEATIRSRLMRARKKLQTVLGGVER